MAQGVFTFGPITGQLSASMTIGLGINPSPINVDMHYLPSFPARVGTAQWWVGGSLVRSFPNAALSRIRSNSGERGTTFQLTILDRRWMWGQNFNQITGEYNYRVGQSSAPVRRKTAQELAALCLNALGENAYNVLALPTNDFPYVNWEIENPAKALADLCDLYGCAVNLELNNTVRIVRLGEGLSMPAGYLHFNEMVEGAKLPRHVAVVSAPTEWQIDLELEAVGLNQLTNEFVPIADLPYTPLEGWYASNIEETEFDTLPTEERKLALKHVHRTYRIKKPGITFKDAEVSLTEIGQILPLIALQVETEGTGDKEKRKEAEVFGRFNGGIDVGGETMSEDPTPGQVFEDIAKYKGSFSVDAEQGLVQFSEPLLGVGENDAKIAPKLILRCTVNLYETEARKVQRYKVERPVDLSSPAGTAYDVREDIIPQYIYSDDGSGGTWTDNLNDVQEQSGFYIDQNVRNYQTFPSAEAEYAGFVPLATDGALRQITYSIDQKGVATTQISRNTEDERKSLSYKQARDRQNIAKLVRDEKRDDRKRKREDRRQERAEHPVRVQ